MNPRSPTMVVVFACGALFGALLCFGAWFILKPNSQADIPSPSDAPQLGGRTHAKQGARDLLVRKWYRVTGNGTFEFFRDGTVVATEGGLTLAGNYRWTDENHLRLDLGGLGALAGPQVMKASIAENELTLVDQEGQVFKYRAEALGQSDLEMMQGNWRFVKVQEDGNSTRRETTPRADDIGGPGFAIRQNRLYPFTPTVFGRVANLLPPGAKPPPVRKEEPKTRWVESKLCVTFRLDPTKVPKWVDLPELIANPVFGAGQPAWKERMRYGIYEIDGDVLRFCFPVSPAQTEADRPKEINAKPGSRTVVEVLERVKQEK